MPRGHAITAFSLGVRWEKLEKNDKVRHNVTQSWFISCDDYCFTWLMVCNVCILQSESEGGLIPNLIPAVFIYLLVHWKTQSLSAEY